MNLYGTPIQNIEDSVGKLNQGLEQIREAVKVLTDYDLEAVFEDVDDITANDFISAIEKLIDGLETIDE